MPLTELRLSWHKLCGVLCLFSVFLVGCQSTKPVQDQSTEPAAEGTAIPAAEAEARLLRAYDEWRGTPHRLGGMNRNGVDCSGLLYVLFPALFDHQLPRTTEDQARTGSRINRTDLSAGDLVFFRPNRKTRHVGVYLSDGDFLHAPNSGVQIDNLSDTYWNRSYWMSRRVLTMIPAQHARIPTDQPVVEQSGRTGW